MQCSPLQHNFEKARQLHLYETIVDWKFTSLRQSPIFHLQLAFAALENAKMNVYDPSPLVDSLSLNPSEQQDAQE